MSTNIKTKKKTGLYGKKVLSGKKKESYNNNLIKWIIIGLASAVAIIVAVFLIINLTSNYVGKVAGKKVMKYEYRYFLQEAITEEYQANFDDFKPEGYDDMSNEEQEKIFESFFTEERRALCEQNALEKAREFKAEHIIAVSKGFALDSASKASVKNYVDSMYAYYYDAYKNNKNVNAVEYAKYLITRGTMTLTEYKSFLIEQEEIEAYKASLKEGYEVSDDELRAVYDENPDDYRTVTTRVFRFTLPTAPAQPKDSADNVITAEIAAKDDTSEADKKSYAEYEKKLADYKIELDNYVKLAQTMKEAFDASADAKFTLYDYDMLTMEIKKEKDADGNETDKDAVKAENATYEELCTSQSSFQYNSSPASTTKGLVTISKSASSGVAKIDEFAKSVQWNSERNGFVVPAESDDKDTDSDGEEAASATSDGNESISATSSEGAGDAVTTGASGDGSSDGAETSEAAKVNPSEIRIIEIRNDDGLLTALYLARVEDITDIDTKPAEGSESSLNSIQSTIKETVLEDKAVAELKALVEAGGDAYALTSVKDKIVKKVMSEVLGD